MPVTAKLSGKFYERFGDDIANELVDWFNAVDATYQTQLKQLNDLNWARMEARFAAFEARMDAFEARLETKVDSQMARMQSRLIVWMFAFWTATVIPIGALLLNLTATLRR